MPDLFVIHVCLVVMPVVEIKTSGYFQGGIIFNLLVLWQGRASSAGLKVSLDEG